ncbi:unnamed protein product [Closterium sp. Naga37s-1]|nr:unnamed protein product [Closterium sp. Naga37s-1]
MSTIMDTPTRSPFLLKSKFKTPGKTGGPASSCRSGPSRKYGQKAPGSLVKAGCSHLKAKPTATPVPSLKKAYKKVGITPKTPFATPKSTEGDRFIPSRSYMNMDVSAFAIRGGFDKRESTKLISPGSENYRKRLEGLMSRCLDDGEGNSARKPGVLSFKVKTPAESNNGIDSFTKMARGSDVSGCQPPPRVIPQVAEKTLDAPGVVNNFYLQLIDWSISNLVAVAIGTSVFIWNGKNESMELMTVETEDEESPYVTGVSWAPDGVHLAIGVSNSEVQVWNVSIPKQVRTFKGHSGPICALDWYKTLLSTGDNAGTIINHDVRAREHIVSRLMAHPEGVCGLKWAPSGRQLASGGDDNLVHIWDTALMSSSIAPDAAGRRDGEGRRRTNPSSAATSATGSHVPLLHRFADHRGAVKALAWCPFRTHLLATGGGANDCTIRFWNTQTGGCEKHVDAESQVTGLHWSKKDREIVSAHGYHGANKNQLIVWKYPSLVPLARLKGHEERVVSTAQAPEGDIIASLSADESLRIWRAFNPKTAAAGTARTGSGTIKRENEGEMIAGSGFGKSQIR